MSASEGFIGKRRRDRRQIDRDDNDRLENLVRRNT